MGKKLTFIIFFAVIIFACFGLGKETSAANYFTSATSTSANLLAGRQIENIDSFSYTASSIPSETTLKVQFSQDNSTWMSSTGTLNGWDNMAAGTNNIDLSALVWVTANFYYRVVFTTSNPNNTPLLDEVSISYTAPSIPCSVNADDGDCDPKAAGELMACKSCDGSNLYSVNITDYAEDNEGSYLCATSCMGCNDGNCEPITDYNEDNIGSHLCDTACMGCDNGNCENFSENAQDTQGSAHCDGTCEACQSGSCGVADADSDPGDDCSQGTTDSDGCRSENCKGGTAECGAQTIGDGACSACKKCNGASIACVTNYTNWTQDLVSPPNTCGTASSPDATYKKCYSGKCCYWSYNGYLSNFNPGTTPITCTTNNTPATYSSSGNKLPDTSLYSQSCSAWSGGTCYQYTCVCQ